MSLPVLYFMSLSIKNIVLTYCELLALVFKHTGVTISLYTNEALYSELLSSQRLSDVLEHPLCIVFTIFISIFLWTIKMLFNSLLQSYFLMTDIQKSEYEYQHLLLASNQIKGENKQSYISVFYSLKQSTVSTLKLEFGFSAALAMRTWEVTQPLSASALPPVKYRQQ